MDVFIQAAALVGLTIVMVTVALYRLRPRQRGLAEAVDDPAQAAAFTAEFVERFGSDPDFETISVEALEMSGFTAVFGQGTGQEGRVEVRLDRLRLQCEESPEEREKITDRFIQGLKEMLDEATSHLVWETARASLMPQLVNPKVASVAGSVVFPYWHELEVRLVLVSRSRQVEVTADHLKTWAISAEEARQVALFNLARRSDEVRLIEHQEAEANTLYVYESRDGFDAARILLEEDWAAIADKHEDRVFIAIPSRDFLIAFTTTNGDHLEHIRAQIFDDWMGQESSRLTWKLFEATVGGVKPHDVILH
jgi:hypothetical protein